MMGIMSKSYFFYDLETSGFSPRRDRIMQFAGIRVDENFDIVAGEEYNYLIYLAEDILPSPTAIITTGITPQKTHEEGYAEADFARIFMEKIATPDTVFIGYNNVRFDDEHMRNFLWRNFRDPYEWEWKNGNSRWDLLDAVRLVRALRPDGINWPTMKITDDNCEEKEISANKLELLSALNKFPHRHAHDALSDVEDTINLARLLRDKQPKIFDFLLHHRDKKTVATIVDSDQPFVYASGRFPSDNEKTSVVVKVGNSRNSSILVYDLRNDVENFVAMNEDAMLENLTADWDTRRQADFQPLPIKELVLNKCPAVAPIGTLDEASQQRIHLNLSDIENNFAKLQKNRGVIDKMTAAFARRNEKFNDENKSSNIDQNHTRDVEDRLYNSFTPEGDRAKIRAVAAAPAGDLADFHPDFIDDRLPELLLRYKARNFPKSLSADEKKAYEDWRIKKLQAETPHYFQELDFLAFLAKQPNADTITKFANSLDESARRNFDQTEQFAKNSTQLGRSIDESILTDLRLWAESIMPYDDAGDGDFKG